MLPRIPSSPPFIKPIAADEQRPLWSVMIPVYNCSRYIPEVLESVMLQNIPEDVMQIEVIDDASNDADVEAIVNRIGKGRIKYFRQPVNVGSLRNFETCLNRSRGRLIHLLHGDDRVKSGYYKEIENLFQRYPEAGAAFSKVNFIDGDGYINGKTDPLMSQNGLLENWLLRIAESNHIQYVSITVRREVYERLGSFFGSTYGEDWEMWVRLAQYYPVAYTPEALADYRIHADSISGDKFSNGESIKDIKRIMNIFKNYLPESKRRTVLRKTRKHFAWYSWSIATSTWLRTRNKQVTQRIIRQTLTICKDHPKICWELVKLYMRTMISKPFKTEINPPSTPDRIFRNKKRTAF